MPVTEFVFIRPKPDTQLRKELDAKLPGVLSGVFSKLPKLDVLCIGSKLGGTSVDTHQQDELCLFLQWQHISGFNSFIGSPEFTTFKESMLPYLAGPPDIQLYESPEDGLFPTKEYPLYLHIMKSRPNGGDTETDSQQRIAINNGWEAFIERSRLASGSDESFEFSLNGFGLRKDNGTFLSITGWRDDKLINLTLNDLDVKHSLQRLQDVAGATGWDQFIFKTQQVTLDK
ncbi:uncharacterized protein TrAtP1_002404 [Trichoderma atroviride]|uniref:ABM domain-containing protein n=1 Tax=Hypocrea atroviridis (strain ATCC 20476 / IMI 206040) TaxID=452589 RepID=G9P1S7_HYPAI|nr:uncharacterized protein TRIATDRAFT_86543 [Trichoderma atroviride IMI 206040]EHK42576.1 hypothetical protein TRIATDRAFT_86543 [Trichoderma atroviride IMI 206040]UKZ61133.1 hypothetical protein TrAtP1_002404 [Trichoderma atroviride]